MAKPLNENLKAVCIETEEGDLIPVMDLAGAKFSELIKSVADNNKAGTLTMKIAVKPSTAGTLAVEEFKASESMGSFLGQKIKGHHEFTKIIEKKDDK